MIKAKRKLDEAREERITMEIVVDAYDTEERAMGWYCYLQDEIEFPFTATCISKRASSPLRVKDEVEVIDMATADECEREMFVTIKWDSKDGLAVPLSQLKPLRNTAEQTKQAVEDWHYWVETDNEF